MDDRSGAPNGNGADRARALAQLDVSRETVARLDTFVALLMKWQASKNLVSNETLPSLWSRHILDSLQLLALAPTARRWVDLGSGAGFPGLMIAIALADRPGVCVDLIESRVGKAAFLREAARVTGAPVRVHAARIEDCLKAIEQPVDVVCARALAPLDQLLAYSSPLLTTGAKALFLKGQDVDAELTQATKCWILTHHLVSSQSDPQGRIVVVDHVEPRTNSAPN